MSMMHDQLISFAWYNILPLFFQNDDYIATFESQMTCTEEIPDIIAFGGRGCSNIDDCVVIECKATRADFLKDKKKAFRVFPDKGMGQKRAYVVNMEVVNYLREIPNGWMCFVVPSDHEFIYLEHPGNQNYENSDKYIFDDLHRNWKAEYATYRYITYWIDQRKRKPKAPVRLNNEIPVTYFRDDWVEHQRQIDIAKRQKFWEILK